MSVHKRFTLSQLLPSEVPQFAALDEAAMSGWPFAQAMAHEARLKNLGSRQNLIESMVRKVVEKQDPDEVYLKVIDEESGEMVAAGSWKREGPAGGWTAAEEESGKSEGVETVFRSMGRAWREFREGWFPNEEIYHLVVLCTHPNWQRQGAGSMVVEWGCKKADEERLKCALHASAAGLAVYTKHGFNVVKETEFSLKEFGFDGVETRRAMIRMPKGRGERA